MSAISVPGALRVRQLELRSSRTVVVECSGKGEAQVRLYLEATASQQAKTLLRFNWDSGGRWLSK